MRRLARVVAVAFGLLAVACAVFGPRTRATLLDRRGSGLTQLALADGKLSASWKPPAPYRPAWAGQLNRLGFRYNLYSDGSGYAWAPWWAPAAASAAIACATGALGWRRRRAAARGACAACGYDLTGNVSGVCPECGATRRYTSTVRRTGTAAGAGTS